MTSLIRLPKPLEIGLSAIVAAAALFALFQILTTPVPRLQLDVANGTYVSSEGGTLILRDGKLSAGNRTIGYAIETDKQGAYVATDGYLLVEDDGTVRAEQRPDLMKSYLNKPDHPSKISLWVWRGPLRNIGDIVEFDRQPNAEPELR